MGVPSLAGKCFPGFRVIPREGIRFPCTRTGAPHLRQRYGLGMQCGADAVVVVVDIVAIVVDRAIVIDVGGVVCIVARRPQPPVSPYNRIPKSSLLLKTALVTIHPPAQQIHTLARQQHDLLVLLGQNALLLHRKHCKIRQNLEVRHGCMHKTASHAHGLVVAFFHKGIVSTKQAFEHVERQILQPPRKREPKLLRAFLRHGHDVLAQFLGFDDDCEFTLLLWFVHWQLITCFWLASYGCQAAKAALASIRFAFLAIWRAARPKYAKKN